MWGGAGRASERGNWTKVRSLPHTLQSHALGGEKANSLGE